MTASTVRPVTAADVSAVREIYAPHTKSAVSFELGPPTVAEMRDRIRTTLEAYPWLVCERGGEAAGYAYAGPHRDRPAYRWSVDCSVYVAATHRRAGVAHGLYTALFGLLARQGYYNAYAGIALRNPASVTLHESMGFEPIGVYENVGFKNGRWRDVGWWGRPLRPRDGAPPEPPASVEAVRGSAAWEAALDAGRAEVDGPQRT